MNTFGRDFVRAYSPAAQQASDAIYQRMAQAQRAKQEEALMAQRLAMEERLRVQRERERHLNDLRRSLAELNVDPSKFGDDPIALSMAMYNARNAFEDLRNRNANSRKLDADASELGIRRGQMPSFANSVVPGLNAPDIQGVQEDDAELGARIQAKKNEMAVSRIGSEAKARVEAQKAYEPVAMKNARAVIEKMKATGAISEEELPELEAIVQASGGKLPSLPTQYREDVAFNSAVLNAIAPLFQRVKELGPDAKSYFGPLDARIRSAKGSVIGNEDRFRAVEQAVNEVTSGRAFEQGGKALTQTELERITGQIGKITDADFASRVEQYYNRAIRDAELVRERLMNDPARFSPEGQAAIQRLSKQIDEAKGLFGVNSDSPTVGGRQSQAENPADEILRKYGIQ